MKVKVRFFTRLREITNKREEEVEVNNSITIKALVILLEEKYGAEFKEYLRNEKGEFKENLQYMVNGKNARFLEGFNTRLVEGDTVAIVPPVGGG